MMCTVTKKVMIDQEAAPSEAIKVLTTAADICHGCENDQGTEDEDWNK